MIAGLSLILDPNNARAGAMSEIVQSFMEQHPHDPAADEFSQKEAAIVRTLARRHIGELSDDQEDFTLLEENAVFIDGPMAPADSADLNSAQARSRSRREADAGTVPLRRPQQRIE